MRNELHLARMDRKFGADAVAGPEQAGHPALHGRHKIGAVGRKARKQRGQDARELQMGLLVKHHRIQVLRAYPGLLEAELDRK